MNGSIKFLFSIIREEVLTPHDFNSLTARERRPSDLHAFYQAVAEHDVDEPRHSSF